jgi:hypothetical protein
LVGPRTISTKATSPHTSSSISPRTINCSHTGSITGTCRDTGDDRVVKDPTAFGCQPNHTVIIDKEQTTASVPQGDDPMSFNTTEVTFHRLYVTHPEPLSLRLTSSPVELHAMATGLLKPLGHCHIAISSAEEVIAEHWCWRYCLCIEPPLHALAATPDLMMTAAQPRGKPIASETSTTTMVDSTSSTAMTMLIGVTTVLCHIAIAGCHTSSVRCYVVSPVTPVPVPLAHH